MDDDVQLAFHDGSQEIAAIFWSSSPAHFTQRTRWRRERHQGVVKEPLPSSSEDSPRADDRSQPPSSRKQNTRILGELASEGNDTDHRPLESLKGGEVTGNSRSTFPFLLRGDGEKRRELVRQANLAKAKKGVRGTLSALK
jgi:hypothetical protein